jgi:capreomycidine synthase
LNLPAAPLEDWLRDYYFAAKADISSSGVEPYGFAEVRELLGITVADLDSVQFSDSRSAGDPRLRRAIAARYGDGDPERVMAANGSSETLFLVLNTVLGSGDEVVVLDPAYHSLTAIAGAIGCHLVRWPLRPEHGFRPDLDELADLVRDQTRAIIVNFPHNPTGISLSAAELGRLTGIAAQAGAYLIWDGAFTDLTHGAPPLPDPSTRYERAITFGTLSKSFGLPGLRVGWCIAQPGVIADCIRWRDYITLALSPLVEFVAIRAVGQADILLRPRLAQARRNLDLVAGWMAEHEGLVEWARPDGGVTAFPRLLGVTDVEAFCHSLMRDYGVLTVPGTCFGLPGHIRLGFGGGTAELRQGLEAMSEQLRARR